MAEKKEKIVRIGIDFGTTYSFAGFLHGDKVMPLIPSRERYGIPSVFYYDGKQQIVGQIAANKAFAHSEYAVFSIKRNLHQRQIIVGGKAFSPKEIITAIIGYVVECAEKMLTEQYFVEYDTIEAVIAVPVDFSPPRIRLIHQAAQEVKLKNGKFLRVSGMIQEPCAAAIEYFGLVPQEETDILVYDLGGGTFDAAWVHSSRDSSEPYQVIDEEGESSLGGDDWDRVLAGWIAEQYTAKTGKPFPKTSDKDLLRYARMCKQDLTEIESTEVSVQIKGEIFETEISRETFDKLTRPLLETTLNDVRKLLERQKDRKLGHVILTGGSTYMPQVLNALKQEGMFAPDMDIRFVEPEHAIAYGAARHADTLVWDENVKEENAAGSQKDENAQKKSTEKKKPIQLIAPHNYGIAYYVTSQQEKEMIYILIRKGTPLPVSAETVSHVHTEGITSSIYTVYESNNVDDRTFIEIREGKEIMTVSLDRAAAVPKGTKAKQILTLGEDMILRVKAEDTIHGIVVERNAEVEMKF